MQQCLSLDFEFLDNIIIFRALLFVAMNIRVLQLELKIRFSHERVDLFSKCSFSTFNYPITIEYHS